MLALGDRLFPLMMRRAASLLDTLRTAWGEEKCRGRVGGGIMVSLRLGRKLKTESAMTITMYMQSNAKVTADVFCSLLVSPG
jgi:hypothetical protein